MQPDFGNVRFPQRSKRPQPDVQRDVRNLSTGGTAPVEYFGSEMQAGCRRRNGAALFGKNGLIPFAVSGAGAAMNVRWKRSLAQTFQKTGNGLPRNQANGPLAELACGKNFRFQILSKQNLLAGTHTLGWPHQCLPLGLASV